MTCHAHTAPVPYSDHAVLKVTSQDHDTTRHGHAIAWHGMCELASVVYFFGFVHTNMYLK
jgi:hypothetical protein